MKYIQVKDGKAVCTIQSNNDIPEESEFLIKALCGLQIMCVNKTSSQDPKLKDVIEIISDSIKEITKLYKDDNDTLEIEDLFK